MLRNRILLGVAPLLALLVLSGAYAVWLFVRLGDAVNTTLHQNYTSIVAMRDLQDAALRMDGTWSASRAGGVAAPQAQASLAEQAAVCRRNVDAELNLITEPGEQEAANRLKAATERFLGTAAKLPTQEPGDALSPTLNALLAATTEIRRINERAMNEKDQHARETARRSTRIMLLAVGAALVIGSFFAYRLARVVLQPIGRLTDSARELGEGNLDQVLPVTSRDELGQLAAAFNKMAGKLRVYRQTTSEELVHARQATEIVFAALLDPIVIFSAEGEIVYQNPAAERLRKRLAGTEISLPIVPLAMRVLGGGGDHLPDSFEEAICVRLDDREKFLLPRVIGLRDGGAGAVVILYDVTRFRLLDDVKTNLVATVSHELKTPLTSIRMAVYLLLEERIGALNPKQTELLIASRDDAERLLDLINNLLDLARLENGAAAGERRLRAPLELVQRAADAGSDLTSSAGRELAVKTEPGLPTVAVVDEQIGRVFSNLLSNAAKHSPRGEEIILSARQEDGGRAVRFSVTDRGPGILPGERERVFERFYRVAGEPREGAGLGLAICREIVTAHEGRIGVTDGPGGRGSEFYFVLPARA